MIRRRDFLASLGAIGLGNTVGAAGELLNLPLEREIPEEVKKEGKLAADRWLELDLYWFNRERLSESVAQFLERTSPLYKNVAGWRGVIVCVGWMVDYIAGFHGDLDQQIPLATFDVIRTWPSAMHRVDLPRDKVVYAPWTYRDLLRLGDEFRRQAREKYGIDDFKFGTLILGWQSIYDSGVTGWRAEHSEAWNPDNSGLLLGASLRADRQHYAAFPQGIHEGTPFYSFFARQWGELSRAARIDALLLRDGMFGQVDYVEKGPFGIRGSSNPADMRRLNEWTANLVRETKQANPRCLLIGYSTAASAVAEWRLEGFDLEQIAKEGYLDAWIDQSWGADWEDNYLDSQQGYTFQLSYILLHAAQLAGTRTRHYVLIDTWDAWEPWDSLHAVPYKVQWEIWAYTHAAVKMPEGEKLPDGMYISWVNHGDWLWTERDVAFLAETADAATEDALDMVETGGPTLVYNRGYIEWLNRDHPDWLVKEYIDDHAAMLMKWGVPILSVTKIEWLPQVKSDMFIFGSPGHLDPAEAAAILRIYRAGEPLAIVSDPTYGIDPGIGEILEPSCKTVDQQWELQQASIGSNSPIVADNVPHTFMVWQGNYEAAKAPRGTVIYQTNGCADLVLNEMPGKNWIFWNPPFFSPIELRSTPFTIASSGVFNGLIADAGPYVLASRTFIKALQNARRSPFDPSFPPGGQLPVHGPLAVHYWRKRSGEIVFLLGNLERGIAGGSENIKLCWLELGPHFVSPHATRVQFKQVTREVRGLEERSAERGADGRWKAQIPVWPMGSCVWSMDSTIQQKD